MAHVGEVSGLGCRAVLLSFGTSSSNKVYWALFGGLDKTSRW